MANSQMWKKDFAPLSFPRMIDCPNQPGNLKITEKACLKRFRFAQNRKMENSNGEDIFNYFLNQGLLKCQRCPIVKTLVSSTESVRAD